MKERGWCFDPYDSPYACPTVDHSGQCWQGGVQVSPEACGGYVWKGGGWNEGGLKGCYIGGTKVADYFCGHGPGTLQGALDAYNQNPSASDAGTSNMQGQNPFLTDVIVKNSEEIAKRTRAKFPSDTVPKKPNNPISQTIPADPNAIMMCPPDTWGAVCAEGCAGMGVSCSPNMYHPYKPLGGLGVLYSCSGAKYGWTHTCVYAYSNGDGCTFVYPGGLALCQYKGGG